MELNIKEWKKFKISDIFQKADIKKYSSIPKKMEVLLLSHQLLMIMVVLNFAMQSLLHKNV